MLYFKFYKLLPILLATRMLKQWSQSKQGGITSSSNTGRKSGISNSYGDGVIDADTSKEVLASQAVGSSFSFSSGSDDIVKDRVLVVLDA